MTLYKLSIERPVLATVMSIVIVIFGVVSYQRLGVREFPAVDPPIITVNTEYRGAPPEVIESQITEPLEESINAVAGVRTLTSSSREGRSTIVVEFKLGADLETAANDVRDKVSAAQRNLPPDADPPTVTKADADRQPVAFISIYSPERDLLELSDIAERRFKPVLQTIDGVAEASIWGEKRHAMRLWLDRDRLAAYELTPVDIRDALNRENVELPSGRIDGSQVELNVRAASRFTTPEEFNDLILREGPNGVVRLKDVGEAVVGPENLRNLMKRNGVPAVGIALRPQPGANQIEIADEMYRRLELIKKDLPPDVDATVGFDTTRFVRASILEVRETILLAVGLVVLVIFLFLRSWRSTFIPAIVIPVCLVGAFFIMYFAGFSINVLTLLAMVLAIGLVVDDAIVVLENIYSKIEDGMPVLEAGVKGTKEVFFAVIATTIALAAVFTPILFLGGLIGQLFREFAVTLAGTVIISSFVALTLTPMMCTKILRGHSHSRFYNRTEPFFEWLTGAYRGVLTRFLARRWLALPVLVGAALVTWFCFERLQSELAPLEDRARLRVTATAPEGASFDYMLDYMDRLAALVTEKTPEAHVIFAQTAPGFAGGAVNSGWVRAFLVGRDQREHSQAQIAARLLAATRELSAARVVVIQDPTISIGAGGGARLPVQFVIQAQNFEKLREALPQFLEKAGNSEVFSRVDVDLKFNKPELRVEIDRERAQSLGVSARDIGETLNLALAEQRFGYFLKDGKQYYVLGALVREQRDENPDLGSLYVPSRHGAPVRLDNVVKLTEQISPPVMLRFNRYSSATVSAALNPGFTLSQGVEAMERVARETLDETFETDLAGESRDLRDSASGAVFAFVFALALIYFVLAAQFESFRDPLAIMLTVPLALVGAAGSLWVTGQTINLFSQIGMIMLIGLVTKNGILIVEFANQQRMRGLAPLDAAREAAVARFRPVLMTSLSTILGILPIALALGAGAESRRSMGIAVVGGLVISTALTLLVIPAVYAFLAGRNVRHSIEETPTVERRPE
ncbi:MAG TPA: efflux RND transporter permease subunit [Verrucomicrobiota bacterium]|nr:efflux RND transporter permease subunit [Verrucomicrobiota bacterium]